MRRLIFITAAALALVGAGIAVAHGGGTRSVTAVSAGFTATTASDVRTGTCTGADGTYTTTRGRWTGTTSGSADASLNGNATLDAELLVGPSGYGTAVGRLRIDGSGGHTVATFDATYTNGHVAGLAVGHGSAPWNRLVANFSADFSATGGFVNGKLGGGTSGGDAVVLGSGACRPQPAPKPEKVEAHGQATVSGSSITVAGVTCSVPSSLAGKVASVTNGDRVEITCSVSGGTNTLLRLNARGQRDHR